MKENQITVYKKVKGTIKDLNQPANGSMVNSNRLEALTVLTNSILREVEALKKTRDVVSKDEIYLDKEVERFETDLIRCALMRAGGKQRRAAVLLHVKVTTLNAKIKRYGISPNGLFEVEEKALALDFRTDV